jgi:HPt (histidine-containing phosphotransfer) domain-containing protein
LEAVMADVVYVDAEDGKKRVMNNTKLYVRLLGKFKDETKLEPVFAAVAAGRYEEAQGLAHTLKGVTANLSLKELNLRVQELEAQIKTQAVSNETVEAVTSCFAETLDRIDKVMADYA